jgi:predicted ATPase
VAGVLEAAHRAGIVHGDIKPANILIASSGQIKLADFGIARRLGPIGFREDDAGVALIAGTPAYMSPEQARGLPLDGRSDVYSLGVVLSSAAGTGRPEALQEVLGRALAENPGARYQTAGEFRDALTLLNLPRAETRLPARLNRLIGRERELAELKDLLGRDDARLINLTGPGGIGKTRLAIEVAHEAAGRFDGAWFVSLESVREPAGVASAILRGIGLREADARLPGASLIEHLARRRALLVIDNFEQVAEAAPLISSLLNHCPELKVLVTSRALLHVRAEREYGVPPLAGCGAQAAEEELRRHPGVCLFLDRSPMAAPTPQTLRAIAEICERLDGIPLAIELAAGRAKLLSPAAILGRLNHRLQLLRGGPRDAAERHQTLRDTIDWSYELLTPEEKQLLERLSVFDDGASVDAVSEVCCAGGDPIEGLTSLAEKSLLRSGADAHGVTRIRLFETIREYATERLAQAGEAQPVHRRHATWCLTLAEAAGRPGQGSSATERYDLLESEHRNCAAALEWLTVCDAPAAVRMAAALWRFWEARGYWTEGRAQLQRVLAGSAGMIAPPVRARLLYAAGVLADAQGDYAAARQAFEEHLQVHRSSDQGTVAAAINNLGVVALRQGDYEAARAAYQEALEILRAMGSERAVAQCLNNLGHVALGQGECGAARQHYLDSLSISRRLQNTADVAWTLSNLGDVAREESRLDEARSLYGESYALFRSTEDRSGLASCMADLGHIAVRKGELRLAAQFYQESMVVFGDMGDNRGILRALEGFAGLASAAGRHDAALRLTGAAAAIRASLGIRESERRRERREARIAAARDALGATAEGLLAEGGRMRVEDAIECALASVVS